ncbi:GNAT family N-acetyltransferase [Candidatus Leptofilum sp.]|uniref:GNAT family N-acetyltransferase n=1 Tax=Candidatus Leptofilum sp. TaxID=3241576 RepID=UPI003B58D8CC
MALTQQRRAIFHLLDEKNPADGMASYFAFHHPDNRTILRPYPYAAIRAQGYVALSRTGMDLFRPFVTLRLPIHDMQTSTNVIYEAIDAGTAVILNAPARYAPLLHALFEVQSEEQLSLYRLRPSHFEPIINVLVTQDTAPNGLPRFSIRDRDSGVIGASATLNWQSPNFAEIGVTTKSGYRRRGWGRSVVSAMANYLLENGRIPLYVVAQNNEASIQLAESVGFTDTGARETLIQAVLKPQP